MTRALSFPEAYRILRVDISGSGWANLVLCQYTAIEYQTFFQPTHAHGMGTGVGATT